jgi:putative transposase
MTNYRRSYVPGGSFFFTVNLAKRRLGLLTEHVKASIEAHYIKAERSALTCDRPEL